MPGLCPAILVAPKACRSLRVACRPATWSMRQSHLGLAMFRPRAYPRAAATNQRSFYAAGFTAASGDARCEACCPASGAEPTLRSHSGVRTGCFHAQNTLPTRRNSGVQASRKSFQSHEHIKEGIMHTRGHHLGSKLAFLPGLIRRMTVFALLMLLVPTIGRAQIPAREGNTWGWRHHQPTRAGLQRREHTSGIAPSPSQRKALDQQVERLDRRLLDKEPSAAVPQGQR